ncbi:CGGC domain-containing protein [Candidatus Hydrogenedentota bacterium]
MVRIGILTCVNATQDLDCCSYLCLHDLNEGAGTFSVHEESGGTELVGIISCAGCPTSVAPEKILKRIHSLAETGLGGIHIANCVMTLCPFLKLYRHLIEEHFPEIQLVLGTHGQSDVEAETAYQGLVREMLCQKKQSLADVTRAVSDLLDVE